MNKASRFTRRPRPLTSTTVGSAALLGLMLTGCGAAPPTAERAAAQVQAQNVAREARPVSLTLTLAPGHTVQFVTDNLWDVTVKETGQIGTHPPVLRGTWAAHPSLSGTYAALAPGHPIPPELVAAESRLAAHAPDDTPDPADAEPDAQRNATDQAQPAPGAATTWNWAADAQWFLNSFCKPNTLEFCATNVTSAWTRRRKSEKYDYFEVTGLNASFKGDAYLVTEYYKCVFLSCDWRQSYAGHLAPRHYVTLISTTVRPRYAELTSSGQEPRVDLAVNRVLHGDPVPPSIQATSLSGNRFQVTGSGFQSAATVFVNFMSPFGFVSRQAQASGSGTLNATYTVPCDAGQQLGVYATDGRSDPQNVTGTLDSNNVQLWCKS